MCVCVCEIQFEGFDTADWGNHGNLMHINVIAGTINHSTYASREIFILDRFGPIGLYRFRGIYLMEQHKDFVPQVIIKKQLSFFKCQRTLSNQSEVNWVYAAK